MADDIYYIPAAEGEGQYKEKMSRFIAFVRRAESIDEAKAKVKEIQNRYHDARHVCWASVVGTDRSEWQLNDNGEPSGTAGKPILGQINSAGLTNIVVIVVRYFGGIKLGTSGLISAYREAARLAIEASGRKEMHDMGEIEIYFPYMAADGVMRIVKTMEIGIIKRTFDNTCSMLLSIRKDKLEEAAGRLLSLSGVTGEIKKG